MPEYIVYERDTGNVVYAYTADTATDFPEYPFQDFSHESPEFFRFYVVIHLSVFLFWEPGIRLNNDGNRSIL